jgi:hypothetical protein
MKSNKTYLIKSIIFVLEILFYGVFSIFLYWFLYDFLIDHLNNTNEVQFINEFRLLLFILLINFFIGILKKNIFFKNLLFSIFFSYSIVQILILSFNYCVPEYNYSISSKIIILIIVLLLLVWNILRILKLKRISIIKVIISCFLIIFDLVYSLVIFYAVYDVIW